MDRLNEVTQDAFAAVLQLSRAEADALPPPEQLHIRLRQTFDEMGKRAGRAGYSHQDAQDMTYALVALADEVMMGKTDTHRDYWMGNMLQFHYFQENIAGDGFFSKLQTIRSDPQRADVLRIYYLCLLFGFQGRYRIRGGELELMTLTDQLLQDLARARQVDAPEILSPHGKRPVEGLGGVKKTAPLLVAAAGILLAAVVVFSSLRIVLSRQTSSVAEQVSAVGVR